MLEQVMIEAVILSVNLGDSLKTGVQWVYDTQKGVQKGSPGSTTSVKTTATNGGVTIVETTVGAIADTALPLRQLGGWNGGSLGGSNTAAASLGSGLSYYGIFPNVNMTALINATKGDSDARILSTPIVLTTDNTEATITVGEERPVISSSINSGSGTTINNNTQYSARSTYEYRNIGITLTVTPNINPQGFVVMEITQTADDVGGEVTIDGNSVPIISKREISATVAVQDRSTIVLGGLVRKSTSKSSSKIPFLGDIPLIGWLFSTHNNADARTELVVLLTPYVLTTPEQAQEKAKQIYDASDSKKTLWPRGWSQSPLRNDEPVKEDWKKKKDKKDKTQGDETTNTVPVEAPAAAE
jgi:general secretion pathway protein D